MTKANFPLIDFLYILHQKMYISLISRKSCTVEQYMRLRSDAVIGKFEEKGDNVFMFYFI